MGGKAEEGTRQRHCAQHTGSGRVGRAGPLQAHQAAAAGSDRQRREGCRWQLRACPKHAAHTAAMQGQTSPAHPMHLLHLLPKRGGQLRQLRLQRPRQRNVLTHRWLQGARLRRGGAGGR